MGADNQAEGGYMDPISYLKERQDIEDKLSDFRDRAIQEIESTDRSILQKANKELLQQTRDLTVELQALQKMLRPQYGEAFGVVLLEEMMSLLRDFKRRAQISPYRLADPNEN
jgi:hypothetical protein